MSYSSKAKYTFSWLFPQKQISGTFRIVFILLTYYHLKKKGKKVSPFNFPQFLTMNSHVRTLRLLSLSRHLNQ